ncbi:eukaryotic translation initiation factor 3 subunit 8 N-terminus-domain-containing protein [Fimicolochytrium jonesii]|uniref:eukaryotic translation initiation factor 3 subunit 8 N-terminus-domain-containing protein n=1 Tax=Fimicolochytrium jonesii TaxID=1396493 RepID=UPI0022FE17CE|nr:eukaryotic translation initiation factor 3 subunit 8 N-terminus-domain-containing protein [Fimicolochytrium jonesii]KAI8826945.1 eukaryotic translation initiation factor 3 subunit 8 N-terminus-domain-containing protein [Fimicolochytrium jonesii]
MSRFFRGGDSSSESDSDYSSSDEENRKAHDSDATTDSGSEDGSDASHSDSDSDADRGAAGKPATGASKFMRGFAGSDSDEDSDDDTKRVVKSARDKRFDEMRGTVKSLKNAQKINDWVAIQNEFEKLNKAYAKSNAIIQREGVPRFYIRAIVELEDFMKSVLTNKVAVKKMNASSSRGLNAMKQRLRKHNKQFESDIAKFQTNPIDEDASADEAEAAAAKRAAAERPVSESDSDDEGLTGREKWVKVAEDGTEQSDTERTKSKDRKRKPKGVGPVEAGDDFQVVGKGGKVFEVKPENLFKKLQELINLRGKKGTDRQVQLDNLQRVLEVAETPYQKIKVLLALIPARFDSVSSTTGHMTAEMWKLAATELNTFFSLLEEHDNVRILEVVDEEDSEVIAEEKFKNADNVIIRGSVSSLIDRIDDEFGKSLQHMDPHTLDYVNRLRDETVLYALIVRGQKYLEGAGFAMASDLMKMRRVEHVYYKPDVVIRAVEKQVRVLCPSLNEDLDEPVTLVERLCTELYKTDVDRVRTRALLCHVYHLALHDKFMAARDMMLMSHIQDHIAQMEISAQILFNRTMVQLGLCAFRAGLIRDASYTLQEISASGRVKELLAQGVQMQRFSDKTAEQERLEKARQLPFHMHINLELLECVYLTSSMLLEIPNLAANAHEPRRRVISKPFRRMLDYNERQVFSGPPENTRDHVMGAAKALAAGEWRKCEELIKEVKIWDLMPNKDSIMSMLSEKIKEEGLRTYFFSYSRHYESLGIEQLASMFDLTPAGVRGIVSRMIINEEIQASIDQGTGTVVFHRAAESGGDTTHLEHLAEVYADKVATLVESNERLLEARAINLGLQQAQHDKQPQQRGDHRGPRDQQRGGHAGQIGGGFRGGERRDGARQGGYGGDRGTRGGRGRPLGQRAGR